MSPQSDKETRQRIVERSEKLIQESRQLVEAAQAAMRAKDSRKHRDTLGAARERTFQANNNPPPDQVHHREQVRQVPISSGSVEFC